MRIVSKKEGVAEGFGIKLFAEETESANSTLAIRWCIDQGVYDKLREERIGRPFLLLVTVHRDGDKVTEVSRKLVLLSEEMRYIQFDRPGEHEIHVTVVWDECSDDQKIEEFFFAKERTQDYKNEVLCCDSENNVSVVDSFGVCAPSRFKKLGSGSITVDVSEEFFAKEPPEWLSWWVNLSFEGKPIDQCHFKKRCLVAFTVQVPVIPIWIVLRTICVATIAIFFLLTGLRIRKNDLKAFIPFKYRINFLWLCNTNEPLFFNRERLFLLSLAPILHLSALVFLFWMSSWESFDMDVGRTFLAYISITVGAFLLMFMGHLLARIGGRGIRMGRNRLIDARYKKKFQSLICDDCPPEVSIEGLSPKKRTIWLRLSRFKTKMCQPYRRD